ncbi:MAG TPA: PARP-type zinc finger-containing protein, partial [Polyangiaceae bacterium]|nr:PARP-type zinc finger-containing protein [Polyangiaceae bacterium]
MPDALETATSGRAKCRGCGRAIAKGELRFGEALPSAYREGESVFWFHVYCAACMRPEKVLALFESRSDPVADQAEIEAVAR